MAGYSKRTLLQKLGVKDGQRAAFFAVPEAVSPALQPLPEAVQLLKRLPAGGADLDFVLQFAKRQRDLAKRLQALVERLDPDGSLWVSWPKKSSPLAAQSDLDFDAVQQLGLGSGLVDVKVCAVDEDWSGLKFMFRKKDRAALRSARGGPS